MQRVFKHDVYRPCRYGGWRCTSCDRFRGVLTAAFVHTGRLADGRMVSGWEPDAFEKVSTEVRADLVAFVWGAPGRHDGTLGLRPDPR